MIAPTVHQAERAVRATLHGYPADVRCHRKPRRDVCTVDESGPGWASRLIAYVHRDPLGRLRVTWDPKDYALDGADL